MQHFLMNPYLMPFHLSLVILLILSMVETIGYYLNVKPSSFLRPFIPQSLKNSPLINVKFSKILICIFLLLNFSVAGYFIEFIIYAKFNTFVPSYYIILPVLIIAVFFTVFMIHCLDQVIKPQTKRQHVVLIGRLATISSGNARPGFPAQARVRDEFGQLHYIQVEPEFGELELRTEILIIKQNKSHYIAKAISKSNNLFEQ
jgi:hypothetical protein